MKDTSTAPAARAGARRAAPSRLQRVESFLGIAANEAAQAVRRAGLKPGLERSFGCEAQLIGRVIAQEPDPGAELARNGLVTLYIAAPGATVEQTASIQPALEQQRPTTVLAQAVPASQSEAPARRRKSGQAEPAPALDIPPAPRLPGELAGVRWSELEEDGADANPAEPSGLDLPQGDYVIAADALFAQGGKHARAWPALGPISWLRDRLRSSTKLVRGALALLALWLLVALGALLLGHGASRSPRPQFSPARAVTDNTPAQPRDAPRGHAAPPEPVQPAQRPRPPRQHSAPRHTARTAVRPAPSTPAPSNPSPIARPRAPSSSTPAPHHEGGLFSP